MSHWNYADVLETVTECRPDDVALVHGKRRITWREFDRLANGLANHWLDVGLQHQAKVAPYLTNGPEYVICLYAAAKVGLAPMNTNCRYGVDELEHLWRIADVDAVVFQGRFTAQAAAVRARLSRVRTWIHVDDGTQPCPDWATPFGRIGSAAHAARAPWDRTPNDLILI